MPFGILWLLLLIILLIALIPSWPYSRSWGYGPGGIVGVLLVVVIVLMVLGMVHPWAAPPPP